MTERHMTLRRIFAPYFADDVGKVSAEVRKYGTDYRDAYNLTPLLAALRTDAPKIIDFLLRQGAKRDVAGSQGFSPLLTALQQAQPRDAYMKFRLPVLYPLLCPDSIRVKIDD